MNLDILLKQALAEKAAADVVKGDKVKLRDSRLTSRERDEIAGKVREWESAHEYVAVALVFRQTRYACTACASSILAGGQLLEQQKHLRMAGTQRFVPCKGVWQNDLPRKLDVTEVKVTICSECAPRFGFVKETL